ncbi:hypothetical protein AHAS_Ahas17G0077700 [Arachis hypogaea]
MLCAGNICLQTSVTGAVEDAGSDVGSGEEISSAAVNHGLCGAAVHQVAGGERSDKLPKVSRGGGTILVDETE